MGECVTVERSPVSPTGAGPVSRRRPRGNLVLLIWAGAVALAFVLALSGLGTKIDRALDPLRFAARSHSASGQLLIVEMDAASEAAIGRYPWPRANYGQLVDRLRQAGAAAITFDIDFSSTSNPSDDAAFAAALARSPGLVALPAFAQDAGSGDSRQVDSLPIEALRPHVALASVSVTPDGDGVMRDAPLGTVSGGVPRPSLSAHIAGRSGTADARFPIDYAIKPGSIPRLSFSDVTGGRFDLARVRGRQIIVGATAVDMGDRYAVPRWGVIPGVVIQALAAETLFKGVPTRGGALPPLILAALLAILLVRTRTPARLALATLVAVPLLCGAAVACDALLATVFPLGAALALLTTAALGRVGLEIARRFQKQRTTDAATGLPNRLALLSRLAGNTPGLLAVVTIANYEALATVLKEDADRDLILRIADRLRLAAADEMVWRLSDRHLGFVVPEGEDTLDALRLVLLQPVEVRGRRVDATISLGLAHGGEGEAMLAQASMAAEQAARQGVFRSDGQPDLERVEREISLMGELDEAIAAGEQIQVLYQPKLALATNRIASVEALVRWHHPTRGFIPPDLFIPLAEQTDRIAPLTLEVLKMVIDQLAAWRADGLELTAAVNISGKLIGSAPFNSAVEALLAEDRVPTRALIFEVTESATIGDPATAIAALHRYRALGVAISMDDYGTGQSTLTYLKQLPLSELKIDRMFVQHAHQNEGDAVLVRSTIDMAHQLGLKVVGEGVEEPAAVEWLRAAGCDLAQGYAIGKPMPGEAIVAMVQERRAAA